VNMKSKRWWPVQAVAALALMLAASVAARADGPIRIAENDWTGQLVDINLAKIILVEHMGEEVELLFADYTGQWAGLAAGDLDVAMEIWPSFSFAAHQEWIDEKGKVEVIGDIGVIGSSGWFVPTYVIEGDAERGIEAMAPDLKT
jgi:glycine betaine/proline transport system substrate-binding protein